MLETTEEECFTPQEKVFVSVFSIKLSLAGYHVFNSASPPLSIYLMLLSRSITDHHLRCGGRLNFEFSKRGKTFGMGH